MIVTNAQNIPKGRKWITSGAEAHRIDKEDKVVSEAEVLEK